MKKQCADFPICRFCPMYNDNYDCVVLVFFIYALNTLFKSSISNNKICVDDWVTL